MSLFILMVASTILGLFQEIRMHSIDNVYNIKFMQKPT